MLLTQKTLEMNKNCLSLETYNEALKVISSLPEDKVISKIKFFLDHHEIFQEKTIKAYNYYQKNRVNELLA
jgi:uncharacterized protein YbaP (TraB family)